MTTHIHLDCFSGISGNMLLGALLAAGVSEDFLRKTLRGLEIAPLTPFKLHIEQKTCQGLAACSVEVLCDEHHHHRHLADIEQLLEQSQLETPVKKTAIRVFRKLAEAEAAVHGTTPENIHFHEVGSVDAVVDIVGVLAALQTFSPYTLTCSPLPMPTGWVHCAHGEIPLPAPAVCTLLAGRPVYGVALEQELVTPTGAALVTELADSFGVLPPMILRKTACGAGTMIRSDGRPNLLRLFLGNTVQADEAPEVAVLETHIDDWNPEYWPYVSEVLLDAGALDTALIPMFMKKGRPGCLVRVVCLPESMEQLKLILFRETSTLGIRHRLEQRTTLAREMITVPTPWGNITAKKVHTPDGAVVIPEYEACRDIARLHNVAIQTVYEAAGKRFPDHALNDENARPRS